MSNIMLWLIFIGVAIDLLLLTIVLFRLSSRGFGPLQTALRDELRMSREESGNAAKQLREEVSSAGKSSNELLSSTLSNMGKLQQSQLEGLTKQVGALTESNRASLDQIRTTLDSRVKELQDGNEKRLEEMRKTVDEKLHKTLETRLGESFKIVGNQLQAVQQGLGEMRSLATGVGDLKRVLSNVKARGSWAEVQLGAILEQILAPGQYAKNVKTKEGSGEAVEYAICLPGSQDGQQAQVWLPIDSKFPQEDYLRLQEAAERGDPQSVQAAIEALARTIRKAAKDIHDKYLNPPNTTDFAIMFLATEGLYAEVLRLPGLPEELQQNLRIVVAGPTTLAAILSSLRMGFQTLAIEQRADEVRRILAAVKTEFGKFGEVLRKVKKQLLTATNTLNDTDVRTRAMEKKLRDVEQLPDAEAAQVLDVTPSDTVPLAEEDELGPNVM